MINILATGLQEVFKAIWSVITSKDALVVYIGFLLVLIIIVVIRVLTFDTSRVDSKNEASVEEIRKKIKRAVTDSENLIKYDPENKPGVSNLLTIYACLKGIDVLDAEKYFEGKNYGALKNEVADVVVETLKPIQDKYFEYYNNKEYLNEVLKKGKEKAQSQARKKLNEIYEKLGLIV